MGTSVEFDGVQGTPCLRPLLCQNKIVMSPTRKPEATSAIERGPDWCVGCHQATNVIPEEALN